MPYLEKRIILKNVFHLIFKDIWKKSFLKQKCESNVDYRDGYQYPQNNINKTLIFTVNFYRKIIQKVISVKIINFLISKLLPIEGHSLSIMFCATINSYNSAGSLLVITIVGGSSSSLSSNLWNTA